MTKSAHVICVVLALTLIIPAFLGLWSPRGILSRIGTTLGGSGCDENKTCNDSDATAEAGPDQTVIEGDKVVLDGRASRGSVTRGPLPEILNFSCPFDSSRLEFPSEPLSSYVNYVKNGDFGTDMAEWDPVGQVSIANGFAYSGSKSLMVDASQATPAFVSQKIPDPGSLFLLYIWVYVAYMSAGSLVIELVREWDPSTGHAKMVESFEMYSDHVTFRDWTTSGPNISPNPFLETGWHRLVVAADMAQGTSCWWIDSGDSGFRKYYRTAPWTLPPEHLLIGDTSSSNTQEKAFFDKIILVGTGPGGTQNPIVSYVWDLDDKRDSDGDGNLTNDEDATGPVANAAYGDNGDYLVTLTVTDSVRKIAKDTVTVHVLNANPTILGFNLTTVGSGDLGLRVAGRKWNIVNMTLFADGLRLAATGVTRYPGCPDEQIAWILGPFDSSGEYEAVIAYEPVNLNGTELGANPVWLVFGNRDNYTVIDHHTFNVQQTEKNGSKHWNHIDPWSANLTGKLGQNKVVITAQAMDPGSDDITFTWDATATHTYFNDGIGPDLPSSPRGTYPFYASDSVRVACVQGMAVNLTVNDDDGGSVNVIITL